MFEKFILSKMIKLFQTEDIKKILQDEIKKSDSSANTINSLINEFKQKIANDLKILEETIDNSQSKNVEKLDIIREDLDTQIDVLQGTISNNITQTRKLLNLVNRFETVEQQVKSLTKIDINDQVIKTKQQIDSKISEMQKKFDELNKQTRLDTATIIKKIKSDISHLEIRLEAFIDTISEKLAEQ